MSDRDKSGERNLFEYVVFDRTHKADSKVENGQDEALFHGRGLYVSKEAAMIDAIRKFTVNQATVKDDKAQMSVHDSNNLEVLVRPFARK